MLIRGVFLSVVLATPRIFLQFLLIAMKSVVEGRVMVDIHVKDPFLFLLLCRFLLGKLSQLCFEIDLLPLFFQLNLILGPI